MRKIFGLAFLAFAIVGCGQADKDRAASLQQEVLMLKGEVSALKQQLEEERLGPDRLLAKANTLMEQAKYGLAKPVLADLISRYPESEQARKARELSDAADKGISDAAEADRQRVARADANLKKVTDEIKGITWVSHKNDPLLATNMSLYFGLKDNSAANFPLRLKFIYSAETWLFIQEVTIKADDQVYSLGKMDFERDNSSGIIWEWSDSKLQDFAMVEKIAAAKKVVIRFDGRQYYKDFEVPESQKQAMKDILVSWKRYGGKV